MFPFDNFFSSLIVGFVCVKVQGCLIKWLITFDCVAHKFSVCLWTLAAKGFTGLLLDWCRFWGWPVLLDWPPCPLVGQNKFLLIICLVFWVRSTRHLFGVPSEIYACHLFGVPSEIYTSSVWCSEWDLRMPSVWCSEWDLHVICLVFRVRSTHHLFGVPSEIYTSSVWCSEWDLRMPSVWCLEWGLCMSSVWCSEWYLCMPFLVFRVRSAHAVFWYSEWDLYF